MRKTILHILMVVFVAGTAVRAAEEPAGFEFTSGEDRTSVVELYTSEGCSSCPPADRFLSRFSEDPRLWKDLIPVAFHVDYWDYIGWKDRFARPAFTSRQRTHASANADRVYTPAFFVDGREWRGYFTGGTLAVGVGGRAGVLSARDLGDGRVGIGFEAADEGKKAFTVHMAVLGFGVESRVRSGENRGKNLRHDFVVLGHTEGRLDPSGETELPLPQPVSKAERFGLAVWITRTGSLAPLQAVGGFLP